MYVLGEATQDVRQYSLSTPWDVTTISYDSDLLDISALENDPKGMFMTATKLYIIGYQNDTVYQYSL